MKAKLFIQIGGGAGDRDPRAAYRDWFTEYVKDRRNFEDRVIIAEANPVNIPALKECWAEYSNLDIITVAISDEANMDRNLRIYFAEEDKPHFQVASALKSHVLKHYPNEEIKYFDAKQIGINSFLSNYSKGMPIELISIDVEGLDAKILRSLDLMEFKPKHVSIEAIHLEELDELDELVFHLSLNGYKSIYNPWDYLGFDFMFRRESCLKRKLKGFKHLFSSKKFSE
jgi:FkbM family methyltransferase